MESIIYFLGRAGSNSYSPSLDHLDETIGCQPLQRLAYRRATNAENFRQPDGGQRFARF